ncbi:phage tail family protein [Rossellomorea aquimaris]|uniref:distal tail protein Dit n=1 Tax=Rossellomorea aquimaris TaxID=189382 RepID=UPI001CD6BD0B|nr:distal tail protein Dit [Rossellomorea aquimaris]MCA1058121.1 phage tail family protein [Rossellomorea aquimaris]
MLFSFSFDGIKKEYVICEMGKRRSAFAPIKRNLLYVPHRPGALIESTTRDIRVIEQPITINGKDRYDVRRLEEDLADWLITSDSKPLIFDDEPDRIYYAVVDGSLDIEDMARFGKGTITFICADPNKYGEYHGNLYTNFTSPILLRNNGTESTPPSFRFVLSKPTSFLDIIGDEDYMRIGQPVSVDETPFNKYTRLLTGNGENMTGWSSALFSPDGGTNSGTMLADGYDYYVNDFGSGASWHGPTLSRSTSQVASDYLVRAYFNVGNDSKQRARTEIYLLNSSSEVIGKIAVVLRKSTGGVDVEINLRNGQNSKYIVSKDWKYSDFFGYMDIMKEGQKFVMSISQQGINGDGSNYTKHKEEFPFNDLNNEFQADLAAIGMHIGTHGSSPTPTKARIRLVEASKINQQSKGVPYIGDVGDVFEFNMASSAIKKNGEEFTKKDFGARFFHLKKGDNAFVVNPSDAIAELKVDWRDAYK